MLATDKDKPLSGKALNKKLYDEAFDVNELKLETKHNACFVAGTLVHTDKGLVPIEQIKVGDMVLSRHEDQPDGELAYKRVLSTFKSPEKEKIIYVDYITRKGTGYLFCTENHPFWVDELIEHDINEDGEELIIRAPIGWEQAINLDGCSRHSLRTSDGKIAYVNTFGDDNKILGTLPRLPNYVLIFNTEEAIGVIDFGGDYPIVLDGKGTQLNSLTSISTSTLMETEKKRLIINSQDAEEYEKLIKAGISYEKIYEAYVYNIEVEDYHTYFVGDTGIWVHNTNDCFSEDELLDNLNNEGFMRNPQAKAFHGESMPITTRDEILAGTKPVTKGKELYHSAYVSADAQKILNLNPSRYADLATDKENPLSGEALNKKIYNEAFDV